MPREDVNVDHYAALELSVNATTDDIKRQFRKLALKYHPDRNPGREIEFNAKFQQIQAAHEILTDTGRRKLYDRSRLHHNGVNKPKPDRRDATTPSNDSPTARKFTTSTTTRPFAATSRSTEHPFSTKSQWDHASRTYTPGGASAWKAAQERWQQRSSRDVPRTPKKTRENPYVSVDSDTPSAGDAFYRFYKDETVGSSGKKSTRHGFFGDRNPREKEWMESNSEHKPKENINRRSGGIWETKSSSEDDVPRPSTFYAFTPRTRLRTNLRDTSPDKSNAHGNGQNGGYSAKARTTSPSDPLMSPQRSGFFTRPQTMREKEHNEQQTPGHTQDRRKSNPSVGFEGTERRKFSYLFNEDGIRRPHRTAKQNAGSDCEGEDDGFVKARNVPLRQSYPSSRRNTLDRDSIPTKGVGEPRNNIGSKHSDRQRFSAHSHGRSEDFQTPLKSFRSFETNVSSPTSFSGSPHAEEPRPKSFSISEWNTVFSGNENIFAVPPRKGQQSPRKGPTIPKIQTNISSNGARLNFSRPRPTSASAESSGNLRDTTSNGTFSRAEPTYSHENGASSHVSDSAPKNAFIFEDWQKAFAETNPFDINISQQQARSASKHRKTATTKKSASSFTTQKASSADGPQNAERSASVTPTEKMDDRPHSEQPAMQKNSDVNPHTNIPSPVAMDIDTPQRIPTPTPTIPVTPIQERTFTTRQPHVSSPSVSEEDPVSPIKADAVPISPLRSDEIPSREDEARQSIPLSSGNISDQSLPPHSTPHQGANAAGEANLFPNLENLRNIEPLSYPPTNGLDDHWQNMRDNLPFESKPAPFVRLSPSIQPSKTAISLPKPPDPPLAPRDVSAASYDKYCAMMTVYQAHWNEYNAKIVNHMRARLDADILQCAQNKGFATGTSTDAGTGIRLDLRQTLKALAELEEDRKIRSEWESAIDSHAKALTQWKSYLESLGAFTEFD